jgi:hypothetical protein
LRLFAIDLTGFSHWTDLSYEHKKQLELMITISYTTHKCHTYPHFYVGNIRACNLHQKYLNGITS